MNNPKFLKINKNIIIYIDLLIKVITLLYANQGITTSIRGEIMKKILLTGGNGFFASRFNMFYKDKYDIITAGRDMLNIQDESRCIGFIKENKPDYIIHTAAIAATAYCNEHPDTAYEINVNGTMNIAKGCELVSSKLIFISTEQVFNGNSERGPYSEENTPHPDTVYGETKLDAECKLRAMLENLWILRFTWLFGMPERGLKLNPNILWGTINAAISGKKERVPVNEYRGMSYVYDIIEKFDKIFELPYDTYHVGAENNLSRYDAACLVLRELGLSHRINDVIEKDEKKYKNHPRDVRLSTEKIRNHGIKFLNTEEGIRKCIKDYNLIL